MFAPCTQKTCPQCGATLNRLTGPDGGPIVRTFVAPGCLRHRSIAEWKAEARAEEHRTPGVVHACPSCEYAEF